MYDSSYDIVCEVNSKILKIALDMFELYEKGMDKVHSIHSELKELMIKLKQIQNTNNCVTKALGGILIAKIA